MSDIRKNLMNELEATTLGLQRRVADLQQNLAKLQQMVNANETWNQYQLEVWTQGDAARQVAEIAGLLSRQQTLQEAINLIKE